jgi:hypothetical protein
MARRKNNSKWQMHESSQRGLCRAAFVLLGALPLLFVILFSIAQFIPVYQQHRADAWSTTLSGRLGVDVQVAAVESLAPERFVLHGIRLSHPESQASLGRIRSVLVHRKGAVWSIQLDQPDLETRQLATTWQMIHDWFVCRPQSTQPAIRIECDGLRLRDGNLDQSLEPSLEQIAVEIYSQTERTVVGAEFRMPTAEPGAKPCMLRIVRQHSDRHLSTVLEFDSGPTGLPCKLISPVFPLVQQLGDRALFLGNLSLHQRNNTWQADVTKSSLKGIDFGRLASGLDFRFTGEGSLEFKNVRVTDRGLQYALCLVTADYGRIDGNLLIASQQMLGVSLPRPVQTANVELHSFDQLRAWFEIAPGTLSLVGGIEHSLPDKIGPRRLVPGTMIADAAGEIAVRSSIEPMPLQNLVSTLAYSQGVSVASANSSANSVGWLAQRAVWWLPLENSRTLLQADASTNPTVQ